MGKKYITIEYIKNFLEERCNTELLSSEYINSSTSLEFRCSCGNTFNRNWNKLYSSNQLICRECSIVKRSKTRTFDYSYIKNYVENNSECKLLDNAYKGSLEKLKLKCKCGGLFYASFSQFKHKNQRQCQKCGRKNMAEQQKLTIEYVKNFIAENSECKLISTEYTGKRDKLKLQCVCGNIFKTSFDEFKSNNKRQCNSCGNEIVAKARRTSYDNVKNFIENNSKCKIISKSYKNNSSLLEIKCECGKIFSTTFAGFKKGKRQCETCSGYTKWSYDAIEKFAKNKYNLLLIGGKYKDAHSKLMFQCSCGEIFQTSWDSVLSKNKTTCRICSKAISKGEKKIQDLLDNNGVLYQAEYKFNNCEYKRKLAFDFYMPEFNACIEFHGKQHYSSIRYFGGDKDFAIRVYRDALKQAYCEDNNIPLFIIPYWDYDNIEEILTKTLSELSGKTRE